MRTRLIVCTFAITLIGCTGTGEEQDNGPAASVNGVAPNGYVGAPAARSTPSAPNISSSDVSAAAAAGATQAARDALIAKLPTTTYDDGGIPRTRYVWEGDMLLTREQVNAMLKPDAAARVPGGVKTELKVMTDAQGNRAFWPRGQRELTYVVDRQTFPSPAQAEKAATALTTAARDWQSACPSCGLTIKESTGGTATFRVKYQPAAAPYIAASFFPNDPPARRVLFIAAPFYTMSEDPAGVLRHELGHTLGYRHEHIAGVPGCSFEDSNWKALTKYDATSVMHYPCGGGGTRLMKLSAADVAGHSRLYGAP